MHIIVDGYNLMKTDPELAGYQAISLEYAREAVIKRVLSASGLKGVANITLVFDGHLTGQTTQTTQRRGRITVIYSKLGESADEVIKRLVAQSPGDEIKVITRDNELRTTVGASGATSGMMKRRAFNSQQPKSENETSGWNKSTDKKGPSKRDSKKGRKRGPGNDVYW